jgi:predicted nucleotidyltransferase/uncharacterized protein with HEPN domain/DNA-binding XRE family transcriptional regulator
LTQRQENSTGNLLRQARINAQLSQTDVAGRARIAQSVVSAYESGRREPSVSTLERLVRATGHRLVLHLERLNNSPAGLPDTPLGRRLRQRRRAVLACAARHGASNVRVFGSTARGEDRPDSDVDLVVDLDKGIGLFSLEALRTELSAILGVSVDVAPSDGFRRLPTTISRNDRERSRPIMNSCLDAERLADIVDAISAIKSHLARGEISDGLIFDAVRVRFIEIGRAVKLLDSNLVASEPGINWSDAAGMRDWLMHHYFDTSQAVIEATITEDLSPLEAAVEQLQTRLELSEQHSGYRPSP